MKPSEPPRLASWMLEHLVLGNKNDGLTGDLVEEFGQGRSTTWYWRQVLGAIVVGFSNELRGQVGAFGFAFVWTCATAVLWPHIKTSSQLSFLLGWGSGQDWPESLLYVTAIYDTTMTAILWVGLSLYLALMRSFDLRRFFHGSSIGLFVVVVVNVSEVLNGHAQHLPHYNHSPAFLISRWFDYISLWILRFVALLLSIWVARPSLARNPPNRIAA